MARPPEQSQITTLHCRRSVSRHPRAFDQQRARSTHQVRQTPPRCGHLRPLAAHQDRCRQILSERCIDGLCPVSSTVQRATGQIDTDRRLHPMEMDIDPQVGRFHFNGGPDTIAFPEAVDDGVLLGSLPRETANLEQLKQLGVSTIVNLNQQWELDVQPEEIRAAGLKLVWLQTPDYAAPTQGDIQIGVRAAQVGDHAGILVHAGLTNSACRKPSEAGARYTSTAKVGEGGAQS